MVEHGQVWSSGGRAVEVLAADGTLVVVRDSYGWRRSMTTDELVRGFRHVTHRPEPQHGVMARRALADVEPA